MNLAGMLSYLRHEKNLNQRQAAEDLGVSQALLSHYENGVREPKLEFIIRACDYYGVSADFLIGRSKVKTFEDKVVMPSTSDDTRHLADVAALVSHMLEESNDDILRKAATIYLSLNSLYMIKVLQNPSSGNRPEYEASQKFAEAGFMDRALKLKESGDPIGDISDEAIKERYPELYPSYLVVSAKVNDSQRRIRQFSPLK